MTDLTGRKIIITGGTSGMGETLVKAFPSLGAKVIFWGRNTVAEDCLTGETGAIFV